MHLALNPLTQLSNYKKEKKEEEKVKILREK
jgi:hypothetical protein